MTGLRIGTWNLEGKWSQAHEQVMGAQDCDVWLLTEVPRIAEPNGFHRHLTNAFMGLTKWWAGVFSRLAIEPLPDPHPVSAAARLGDLTLCCSVLPWPPAGRN